MYPIMGLSRYPPWLGEYLTEEGMPGPRTWQGRMSPIRLQENAHMRALMDILRALHRSRSALPSYISKEYKNEDFTGHYWVELVFVPCRPPIRDQQVSTLFLAASLYPHTTLIWPARSMSRSWSPVSTNR